jgi:hypothetical protein
MVVPFIASADSIFINLVSLVEGLISALFPILTALGVIMFGYNVMKYLTSKNLADQGLYKAGIWNSLLALFVLFTVLGLVKILASSFGIDSITNSISTINPDGSTNGSGAVSSFRNIALSVSKFLSQRILPIMVAGSLLFFLGNIVVSMSKSDNEQERVNTNAYLKWGVLALFVLLTFFGIVSLFTGSLFGTRAIIPQFQTQCPPGQTDC